MWLLLHASARPASLISAGLLLFSSVSVTFAEPLPEWIPGQLVNTTSGGILGHASAWQPLVSEYLGIPYAQPPLGPLRFAAPQPYSPSPSTSPFVASSYGDSCPANVRTSPNATVSYASFAQTLLTRLSQADDTFSEDCLVLNVWTAPQIGTDGQAGDKKSRKAVLVWIYGGGFNSGSSTNAGYNGARLAAEHDVVVVSMNYRTNIFGFPRAKFLQDLNLGLLDQRLAVEWVRDKYDLSLPVCPVLPTFRSRLSLSMQAEIRQYKRIWFVTHADHAIATVPKPSVVIHPALRSSASPPAAPQSTTTC